MTRARPPDPPPLTPAPAELAALAHATRPDLDQGAVRGLIDGATTAGVPWAHILRRIPWELADPRTTLHDLRTAVYAGAPGKTPR